MNIKYEQCNLKYIESKYVHKRNDKYSEIINGLLELKCRLLVGNEEE